MTNGVEATDSHRGYCSYASIQLTQKYISCQVCFISMQHSSRCANIPLDISQVGVLSNQTSDDVRQSRLADKIYKRVKIKVKIIRILYLHVKVKFLISDMVSDD